MIWLDHLLEKVDHLQVIWLVNQDQWTGDQGETQWANQDQWDHPDKVKDPKDQIHYLVTVDQQVDHLRVTCLLREIWDQVICLLQGIWDQDLMDQWDLQWMTWVRHNLIWTMQAHTMDRDLRDQMDLLQELTWMVTGWLRLRHQTTHLTM